MAKLPTDVSGRKLCTALERIGFVFRRQRGSHMVLRRENPYARVIVPDHKSIRSGTLRQILHDAELSLDELLRLLGRK
jgi:predicted RNA binding protein YcfA (HicA-like mRNA interferase family)